MGHNTYSDIFWQNLILKESSFQIQLRDLYFLLHSAAWYSNAVGNSKRTEEKNTDACYIHNRWTEGTEVHMSTAIKQWPQEESTKPDTLPIVSHRGNLWYLAILSSSDNKFSTVVCTTMVKNHSIISFSWQNETRSIVSAHVKMRQKFNRQCKKTPGANSFR